MRGSDFDTVHDVTVDELVIGRAGRAVAVRVIVSAARGQVMIGAERAVRTKASAATIAKQVAICVENQRKMDAPQSHFCQEDATA